MVRSEHLRSEHRRGMPLTGWSFAPSFACASRVFGVRASAFSDRGATRRARKIAALGASAALTLLPLWTPLVPAAWATDPTLSASPSPKREVTATPSPSATAVPKTSATPSKGTSTMNGDDVRQREYWLKEYGITAGRAWVLSRCTARRLLLSLQVTVTIRRAILRLRVSRVSRPV